MKKMIVWFVCKSTYENWTTDKLVSHLPWALFWPHLVLPPRSIIQQKTNRLTNGVCCNVVPLTDRRAIVKCSNLRASKY